MEPNHLMLLCKRKYETFDNSMAHVSNLPEHNIKHLTTQKLLHHWTEITVQLAWRQKFDLICYVIELFHPVNQVEVRGKSDWKKFCKIVGDFYRSSFDKYSSVFRNMSFIFREIWKGFPLVSFTSQRRSWAEGGFS